MPKLAKNRFPYVKGLGTALLSYVLAIEEAEVEQLMAEGGEVPTERLAALVQLDRILMQVRQGRQSNKVLEWHDRMALRNLRFQDGSLIFPKLRNEISGKSSELNSDDPVLSALAPMCSAVFPYTLLPTGRGEFPGHLDLPHFYGAPELGAFHTAVLADESLQKLFNTVGENDLDTVGRIYTSAGSGGTIQLASLHNLIFQNANTLMCFRDEQSEQAFWKATQEVLNTMRLAANGQPAKTFAMLSFDGVGLPKDFEVQMSRGTLKSLPNSAVELLPQSARPIHTEQGSTGAMLVFEVGYKIFVAPSDYEHDLSESWPVELSLNDTEDMIHEVSLITALAFNAEIPSAASYTSTVVVDPLRHGASIGWREKTHTSRKYTFATEQECAEITKWAALVRKGDNKKIVIAIRRYLSSITERSDISDSLVDAVIGLENLFGQRTEIGFAISSSVSRLLSDCPAQRGLIFDEVKKIYGARSSIVHGGRKLKQEDVIQLRNRAVSFLSQCLKVLYEKHSDLLKLDANERVKKIVLMD